MEQLGLIHCWKENIVGLSANDNHPLFHIPKSPSLDWSQKEAHANVYSKTCRRMFSCIIRNRYEHKTNITQTDVNITQYNRLIKDGIFI